MQRNRKTNDGGGRERKERETRNPGGRTCRTEQMGMGKETFVDATMCAGGQGGQKRRGQEVIMMQPEIIFTFRPQIKLYLTVDPF